MKKKPDKEQAKTFLELAEEEIERISDEDIEKYPSLVLKDYYEALRYLMEGLASIEGVKIEGEHKHKKLINWACDLFSLESTHGQLLQNIRKYRNRVSYEGYRVKVEFLKRNKMRIMDIFEILRDKLKENYDNSNPVML